MDKVFLKIKFSKRPSVWKKKLIHPSYHTIIVYKIYFITIPFEHNEVIRTFFSYLGY